MAENGLCTLAVNHLCTFSRKLTSTGFYYTGSGYYDPANGQSFACQDQGWVDPGEDLCGEDESHPVYCANALAHTGTLPNGCGAAQRTGGGFTEDFLGIGKQFFVQLTIEQVHLFDIVFWINDVFANVLWEEALHKKGLPLLPITLFATSILYGGVRCRKYEYVNFYILTVANLPTPWALPECTNVKK